MAFVKEGLPDLLLHLDSEVLDVEISCFYYFVMNFVVACRRDLHLKGNVLDGEGSEVAFDKPQTGRPTDHSSIYINSSNSQNEGVCVGLKWKVSNSEAIDAVSMNRVDLNIVQFQESLFRVVNFKSFVLENFIGSKGCGKLKDVVKWLYWKSSWDAARSGFNLSDSILTWSDIERSALINLLGAC